MKKIATLIFLCISSLAVIYAFHQYNWNLVGWTRLLIAAPIIYAGVNYRRTSAISIAIILVLAEGPLFAMQYAGGFGFGVEVVLVAIIVSIFSVVFGHILRKSRENSATLQQTTDLIQSMRRSVEEDSLLSTLEAFFADAGKSDEVETFMFGEDGKLRPRKNPDLEPLPEGHIFYTVAETREFMASTNTARDSRLTYYGPENQKERVSRLAVFPLEYGDRARGVISIANSTDDYFEKDRLPYLIAIKQSVENALDLGEKLRGRIQHEIQRNRIRDTFSSYLSHTVAEEILKNPDKLDLGGEVRDVTVMFTEVTNFSALLKTLPPEELLSRLNEYFSTAIDTIFEYDGTLDKFIGDNIMAFWGAPLANPDSERKAISCARELHRKLDMLNARWERDGMQPFNVCIGINSGAVIAGNIGSIRRMEYTIVGDTVNTAARIKTLSTSKGIPILIGEPTFARVKDSVKVERKHEAVVKGKSGAITVYQLSF